MVTSCQKPSADQAPNGINGGVAGPFMPAWCLICAALLACLSPAPPTKSLDLSLTLTNNVIHVNDVPEHLLTMYPVCTIPTALPCKSFYEFFLGDQGGLATLQALTSVAQEVSAPQEFFSAGLVKDNG